MDTSRIDGVKAPRHRGTPSSHLQDGLDAFFFFDGFQSRFFTFSLNFFQDRLTLLELLLDLLFTFSVSNSGFFRDARLRLDPHRFELLGDLALLPGDGAHGLELLGDGLGPSGLHLLLLGLDLRRDQLVSQVTTRRLSTSRGAATASAGRRESPDRARPAHSTNSQISPVALSTRPRRGPKRLKIGKETTLMEVRWTRVHPRK